MMNLSSTMKAYGCRYCVSPLKQLLHTTNHHLRFRPRSPPLFSSSFNNLKLPNFNLLLTYNSLFFTTEVSLSPSLALSFLLSGLFNVIMLEVGFSRNDDLGKEFFYWVLQYYCLFLVFESYELKGQFWELCKQWLSMNCKQNLVKESKELCSYVEGTFEWCCWNCWLQPLMDLYTRDAHEWHSFWFGGKSRGEVVHWVGLFFCSIQMSEIQCLTLVLIICSTCGVEVGWTLTRKWWSICSSMGWFHPRKLLE